MNIMIKYIIDHSDPYGYSMQWNKHLVGKSEFDRKIKMSKGQYGESRNVETKMRAEGDGVQMRLRVREISTSTFYTSTFRHFYFRLYLCELPCMIDIIIISLQHLSCSIRLSLFIPKRIMTLQWEKYLTRLTVISLPFSCIALFF
jgi:hypothetical protein